MKRVLFTVFILAAAVSAAHAHFIWIIPDASGERIQVVFSDVLGPDSPKLLDKIMHNQLFLRSADGKDIAVKATKGKEALEATLPSSPSKTLGGVCQYGVLKKGDAKPFLLMYYSRAHLPGCSQTDQQAPWQRLPLDIVNAKGSSPQKYQVLWQGKPLAAAEVVVVPPGDDLPATTKTDAEGVVDLGALKTGPYGIRAKHVESKEGKLNGEAYDKVRHYSTLVFDVKASK